MRCSICGKEGHNARTCPFKDKEVPRDHALWMKFDNLTEREAADLHAQVVKDKARIAPKARGTAAKGDAQELPGRIQEALKLLGGDNGTKKK